MAGSLAVSPRKSFFYEIEGAAAGDGTTFEAWLRLDPDVSALLWEWEDVSANPPAAAALRLRGDRLYLVRKRDGQKAGQQLINRDDLQIADGRWHHLAVMFDGGGVAVYRDGSRLTGTRPGAAQCGVVGRVSPTMGGAPKRRRSGQMLRPRLWSRALDEAELRAAMSRRRAAGMPNLLFEGHFDAGAVSDAVSGRRLEVEAPGVEARMAEAGDPTSRTICATDLTLTQDMIGSERLLNIEADTLTLSSKLKIPAAQTCIFARMVNVIGDASFDLSGAAGADAGGQAARGTDGNTPGQAGGDGSIGAKGGPGGNAGSLSLVTLGLTGKLTVMADGGTGGSGQAGGPGGNGAPGEDGQDANYEFETPTAGGKGGDAGSGGAGGPSGDGGNGGSVSFVYYGLEPPSGVISSVERGQPSPRAAVPGWAGAPGPGGRGGSYYMDTGTADYGPPGDPGRTGPPASFGALGLPGSATSTWGDYDVFQKEFATRLPLAHLSLHKAERLYFNGDYPQAAAMIDWLWQAATGKPVPDKTPEWTAYVDRVAHLQTQLRRGLNYYGQRANHVPLTAANEYLALLPGLIAAGRTIEADYQYYGDKNNDAQARIQKLKDRAADIAATISQLEAALADAQNLEAATNGGIAALDQQVEAQAIVLSNADLDFQNALAKQAQCDHFRTLLDAVKGIVSVSKGDIGSLAGTAIAIRGYFSGVDPLPGFIQQIPVITYDGPGSMDTIRTTWSTVGPLNTPSAPNAGKMAMTLEEFDAMIQPYLAMPSAVQYLLAMHTYVALTRAYNNQILTYDAVVIKAAQLEAKIGLKKAENERISNLLADVTAEDVDLPDFTAYIQGVHQDSMSLILNYLYQANAALNYYMLGQEPIKVGGSSDFTTMADIAAAFEKIATELPEYINGSSGPQEPFLRLPVELAPAPDHYSEGQDPFALFLAGDGGVHRLRFAIPPDPSLLPGRYQLVANAFTVSVKGFKATGNALMVRLTHSGHAAFTDSSGGVMEYTHPSVQAYYSYVVGPGGSEQATGGGALGGAGGPNRDYIGLSPCTAWLLEINASDNPGLDLSAVTGIELNFSGLCRLTPPEARSRGERPERLRARAVTTGPADHQ